jgi:hypothetical protein
MGLYRGFLSHYITNQLYYNLNIKLYLFIIFIIVCYVTEFIIIIINLDDNIVEP